MKIILVTEENLIGEGGTFALFQGLYPKGDREGAEGSNDPPRGQHVLQKLRWPLQIWALFGTALTLSDGIFTAGTPDHTLGSLS